MKSWLSLCQIALASILLASFPPALPGKDFEEYKGKTVTVHLRERGNPSLEGKVLAVEDDGILLQILSSQLFVKSSKIKTIDVRDVLKEYQEKRKACSTVDDLVELARWCGQLDVDLQEERQQCLDQAVEKEPGHIGARYERGEVKYRGKKPQFQEKWIKKADYGRITGEPYIWGQDSVYEEYEGVEWPEAEKRDGKNYSLICNSTPDVARRYLDVLEALHLKYVEVFGDYPQLYSEKGTVYVYRNRDEYLDFTFQEVRVGGYFNPIDRAVRTYHGFFGIDGNTEMILAHEVTHMIQHRIVKHILAMPFWIREGMAVYFGEGARINSRVRPVLVELNHIPRHRLQSLKVAIRLGGFLSLPDLFIPHPEIPLEHYYHHGWGVIFWCLEGENNEYKSSFGKKGAGRRIWKNYLEHLTKMDLKEFRTMNDLIQHYMAEMKYFIEMLMRETGLEFPAWEEKYKNFILNHLRLEKLGSWNRMEWDGSEKVGIRINFPRNSTPVDEEELRLHYEEAAAAISPDGERSWLSIHWNPGKRPKEILRDYIRNYFQEVKFDEEFEADVGEFEGDKGLKIPITAFQGRFHQEIESRYQQKKGDSTTPESREKKEKASSRKRPSLDLAAVNHFRLALFSTPDRIYLVCLASPGSDRKGSASSFNRILKTVKLNY